MGIQKEYAQVVGRSDVSGTDSRILHEVLARGENRYLARSICWLLTIEGLETYILMPRDPRDFDLLTAALRPSPRPTDVDVVIGRRGPIAPPSMCNGLQVPMLEIEQLYSFDVDGLVGSIPRPEKVEELEFRPTAEELFFRIIQLADNAGSTDEHRALNYLAVRYPAVYATAANAHARNFGLSSVEVRPSALATGRNIVEVIFTFTNRGTDVAERHFARVDVTEQFPFLVTKISPFVER